MKNTNWLKKMSWTEFDERRKTCDTVIVPGGAIEVYGPHMPLGSDSIVSAAICELVAQKVNAVIGPMIEVGESASLYQFPGTVRIMPETYAAITRDIMNSMIKWGFKNFMSVSYTHLEDSGPKISMILPLGTPPIPKAWSSSSEPVGIASTLSELFCPSFITAPLPNWRSI